MDCISPSLICANHLNFEKDLQVLAELNIKKIHFDVMDNIFVPRFGLYPEQAEIIAKNFQFDIDVHLMVSNPYNAATKFAKAGAASLTVHAENLTCVSNLLKFIKSYGLKAGVALNPETSIEKILDLNEQPDHVCLMFINPGVLNSKVYDCYDKINKIRKYYPSMKIQIDGGVTFESAPKLLGCGATELVCGSATLFKTTEGNISDQYMKLLKVIS